MIAAALMWLLQDLCQVLAMGFLLVPEFFLLVVLYKIVSGPQDAGRISWWLWFAFAGGVLWDLRWAADPGMSGLVNVAAVAVAWWIWDRTPQGGRSALLFAAIAGGLHFFSGLAHYLAWAVPSLEATRMFLAQQLMMAPLLAVLCMIYAFGAQETHV